MTYVKMTFSQHLKNTLFETNTLTRLSFLKSIIRNKNKIEGNPYTTSLSPDWSRGLIVHEPGEPGTLSDSHGWSKFLTAAGAPGSAAKLRGVLAKLGGWVKAAPALKTATIPAKKLSQFTGRGWTSELMENVLNKPYTTRSAINKANKNPATAYYNKSGDYIVLDDLTNTVIQFSKVGDRNWIPDATIVKPYTPKR